eukprot:scaffold623606_cov18-Prasinocladus_malaysianus.AAC.1
MEYLSLLSGPSSPKRFACFLYANIVHSSSVSQFQGLHCSSAAPFFVTLVVRQAGIARRDSAGAVQ